MHRAARVRPNPSLNRTRYGKRRKPGLRHMVHHLSPGLGIRATKRLLGGLGTRDQSCCGLTRVESRLEAFTPVQCALLKNPEEPLHTTVERGG